MITNDSNFLYELNDVVRRFGYILELGEGGITLREQTEGEKSSGVPWYSVRDRGDNSFSIFARPEKDAWEESERQRLESERKNAEAEASARALEEAQRAEEERKLEEATRPDTEVTPALASPDNTASEESKEATPTDTKTPSTSDAAPPPDNTTVEAKA